MSRQSASLAGSIGVRLGVLSRLLTAPYAISFLARNPRSLLVRSRGGRLGWLIHLCRPWIMSMGIATILDIGADVGEFACTAAEVFPEAWIYAFEPLPDRFRILQARMKRHPRFAGWEVALGNRRCESTIERNTISQASSLLGIGAAHLREFPDAVPSSVVTVREERLDDLADQMVIKEPMLVKIDVQGYEDRVLAGAQSTIRTANILIIETSFEHLYTGQALFPGIYETLVKWGYTFLGGLGESTCATDGRPLQCDSIFVRPQKAFSGVNDDHS